MAQLTGAMVAFPGSGTSVALGATTTDPRCPIAVGTRQYDAAGNEYVFCNYVGTMYGGMLVVLSRDGNFTATPFIVGAHGPVGVIVAPGTSDQAGWVQVGGYALVQCAVGSSLGTSSGRCLVATSLSTPATGLLTVSTGTSNLEDQIQGMWPTQLTSTGTTAATSHTGLQTHVWMDHPYILIAATS